MSSVQRGVGGAEGAGPGGPGPGGGVGGTGLGGRAVRGLSKPVSLRDCGPIRRWPPTCLLVQEVTWPNQVVCYTASLQSGS